MTIKELAFRADPDGRLVVLNAADIVAADDYFEWTKGAYTKVGAGAPLVGRPVGDACVVCRIVPAPPADNADLAVGLVQAVALVRRYRHLAAPTDTRDRAMGCLTRRLSPFVLPGRGHALATLLIDMVVAREALDTPTPATPSTVAELEGHYDDAD